MSHSNASPLRLPALDGLRAICILLVCYSHLSQLLHARHLPGTYGVTIFFFISGFIITRLLLQESRETGTFELAPFYIRRWFRLTPALLVYVFLSVAVLAYLGKTIPLGDVSAVLLYYANYHDIFTQFATFPTVGAGEIQSPFVITWSLAVEEHFYLLFPLLLLALRRHTAALGWVLVAFVIFTLGWRFHLAYGVGEAALPPLRIYAGTDTRLDSIAYGCLLSVMFHRAAAGACFEAGVLRLFRSYRGVGIAAALFLLSMAPRSAQFKDAFMFTLEGIGLIALFGSLFWHEPVKWLKAGLENRHLVFIGTISYSLYLYHYLGFVVAQILVHNAVAQVLLAAVLGLFGAMCSHHFVETPSRKFGSALAALRLRRRSARGTRRLVLQS
jgi:peptidoglycan/LPS O-acetylase OafA/YrhL